MKAPVTISLHELAERLGGELRGDGELLIGGVAELDQAGPGELAFLAHRKYRPKLRETRAGAVILSPAEVEHCPVAAVVVTNPQLAWARALAVLYPEHRPAPGVAPSAVVAPGAEIDPSAHLGPCVVVESGVRIGAGVVLGPGCFVGREATIGEGSRLLANVTLYHDCHIGRNCLIHAGTVIGSDGFGLANDGGRWVHIPQIGRVIVGDDVEMGANCAIDRGALGDTVIEEGVKLDNQVHVAHNVHIGAHTAIAGCVGIAGSTRIGARCAVGGAAAITGHIEIADGVQIGGMAMVTRSIREAGAWASGLPAQRQAEWRRAVVRFRNIDELVKRVEELERRLQEQENKED
ncbi:MAG TPA: UDP-3-O-(3-hydroxymyristoyl)glucosamine N-acyltransferase [Thiotrichales bacterium]|nr:UDP-3-O-(3-hydroxymyristoyl)glucosamine N-acyltransferase [Thiotrichales bacterium]